MSFSMSGNILIIISLNHFIFPQWKLLQYLILVFSRVKMFFSARLCFDRLDLFPSMQLFPWLRLGRNIEGPYALICICQWLCLSVPSLAVQLLNSCVAHLDANENFPFSELIHGCPCWISASGLHNKLLLPSLQLILVQLLLYIYSIQTLVISPQTEQFFSVTIDSGLG